MCTIQPFGFYGRGWTQSSYITHSQLTLSYSSITLQIRLILKSTFQQDDRLCYIIYNCNWHSYDAVSKKRILLLLIEAQQQKDIQLGLIGNLNLVTGVTVRCFYFWSTEMLFIDFKMLSTITRKIPRLNGPRVFFYILNQQNLLFGKILKVIVFYLEILVKSNCH